ncbi:MAG: DUF7146 domain-containing protein [Rhodoplanes sp.]
MAAVIGEVARRLLGEPNRRLSNRRTLRFGRKGALAIYVDGERRGFWHDFATGARGGVLDLVVRERGGDRSDAFDWLRDQRFADGGDELVENKSGRQVARDEAVHATLSRWGRRLWSICRPITADDSGGRYLRARGCALPPQDSDLKWFPRLRHPCGHAGPALVGLVTAVTNANVWLNLHRTWIAANGSGRKVFDHMPKDERPQARLVLKNHTTAKSCIRLWPDCDVDTRLTIGEGIESCLAAATHSPVWSCLYAGNSKTFPILVGIEALTVVCDHDPAGVAATLEAGARWRAGGRNVAVHYPTEPQTDWADVVGAIGAKVKEIAA